MGTCRWSKVMGIMELYYSIKMKEIIKTHYKYNKDNNGYNSKFQRKTFLLMV